MTAKVSQQDRARGALLGTLVGDAFGNPLEGAVTSAVPLQVARRAKSTGPWRYTDDGVMFIALAESILEAGTVDPVHFLRMLGKHYDPARGFGRGMKIALRAFESGVAWHDVAHAAWPEGSRGNGGVVRVGAVVLRPWLSTSAMLAAARVATRVTHAHEEAITMALLQCTALSAVLNEPELVSLPADFLRQVSQVLPPSPLSAAILGKLRSIALTDCDPGDIAQVFGTSPLAIESVPAAIASFLKFHDNFEHAIRSAALMGGDLDSICALVGCLAGALHGRFGIPETWLSALRTESLPPDSASALVDALASLEPIDYTMRLV